MITATGLVTVVPDPNRPGLAQLDVIREYCNDDEGELFKPLVDLIGQEVFVLVVSKTEMLKMCQCGHLAREHFRFDNWDADDKGRCYSEPDAKFSGCRYVNVWHVNICDIQCECETFKET
jgi:hypothetical protein